MRDRELSVVALVGPTGSGKSEVAMDVARRLGPERVEIVAIDAFTVYRGMDIGTATPSQAERAAVRHHMVDLLEPEQECSVQWFQSRARAAIAEVLRRDRLPLLVGGSGLYYRAVVDPLEFPPTDPAARDRIRRRWADDPRGAHGHLAGLDAVAAGRIEPDNLRRTVRALEVIELTGRPFSSYHAVWDTYDSVFHDLRVYGVDIDRGDLATRIERRVQQMLDAGWVEEVRALRHRDLSGVARQAIGYAELLGHLDGELTLQQATERIIIRTRQFGTRQLRWFGRDPRISWRPTSLLPQAIAEAVQR